MRNMNHQSVKTEKDWASNARIFGPFPPSLSVGGVAAHGGVVTAQQVGTVVVAHRVQLVRRLLPVVPRPEPLRVLPRGKGADYLEGEKV